MSETDRRKSREYFRKRYEDYPEKYEKDKQRYRQYIKQKRQDPEYRQMENDKRRERRQRKRESLSNSSAPSPKRSSRCSITTKSPPATKPRRTPRQIVVQITETHSVADAEEPIYATNESILDEEEVTLEEVEAGDHSDLHLLKEDIVSPEQHYEISYANEEEEDPETIDQENDSVIEVPSSPIKEVAERETIPIKSPPPTKTPSPSTPEEVLPPCPCSQSAALKRVATLSRELPVFERRRLESGILQFADDFMNTPADDTFTLLICNKLKRVCEDMRPDLEVAILRAINDTLKNQARQQQQ